MNRYCAISSCFLLAACGGKGTVDLGGNSGKSGWANTKGSILSGDPNSTPITTLPTAAQQTLYDGDIVRTFAVDNTSIAAVLHTDTEVRIDLCQLEDCQATLQTIYRVSQNDCQDAGLSSPNRFDHLVISHGELIWPGCSDSMGGQLLACPTSGCPEGPRVVAPFSSIGGLAASHDWVYWWEWYASDNGIARCPRTGCTAPERHEVSRPTINVALSNGTTNMTVDEPSGFVYLWDGSGMARIAADFSDELTTFYEAPSDMQGLALVDDHLYFAISTLTGEILRCPTSGCEAGPETVVQAPRWPTKPVADRNAIYWIHRAEANVIGDPNRQPVGAAVSVFRLDGSQHSAADIGSISGDVARPEPAGAPHKMALNSHHVYWSDSSQANLGPFPAAIRMISR